MARKRRKQTKTSTRNNNSLLTIVLAVGAVLLFSGQLTGAQVGTQANSLAARQLYDGGVVPGSQIGAGKVCYSELFGDTIYENKDVFRTGVRFQGQVSNVIGRCVDGEMFYDVCPKTKTSLGQRKLIFGGTGVLECITHDSRAFLNSAGTGPGTSVQPRGPTLSGASL
jgi:hypothetical protein